MSVSTEVSVAPVAQAAMRPSKLQNRDRRAGTLFVAPAVLVMAIVVGYPLVWSLKISVFSNDVLSGGGHFVGAGNYSDVFGNPQFKTALMQTLAFVACALVLEIAFGMAIALALNAITRGNNVFRVILSLPLMVAPVVAGFLFRWIFTDQYGVANYVLGIVGISGPNWLGSAWGARSAILISDIWLATPFIVLVFYASLAGIPTELIESAKVEGAGAVKTFRYITLPLLKPALMIVLVFRFGDTVKVFDTVYLMTQGGPGNATDVLSSFIYRLTFSDLNFGGGAAASVLTAALILGVSFLIQHLLRRDS